MTLPKNPLGEHRLRGKLGRPTNAELNKLPVNPPGGIEYMKGDDFRKLPQDTKLALVKEYFTTGNLSVMARKHRITYRTLHQATQSDWWREEWANLERDSNSQLRVKLSSILDTTITQLEERLQVGDRVWKDGALRTVPVPAASLAAIANAIFTKKRDLDHQTTPQSLDESRRLFNLASLLRTRDRPSPIIDIDPIPPSSASQSLSDQDSSNQASDDPDQDAQGEPSTIHHMLTPEPLAQSSIFSLESQLFPTLEEDQDA